MTGATVSEGRRTARWGREVTTLRGAIADFLRRPSPYVILTGIVAALALRIWIGDFGPADVAAIAGMLVVYPFGEWAIHVYLLHMKPFRVRGKRVLPVAARAHRAHHRTPNDLDQLLLYWWQVAALLVLAVPQVLIAAGAATWLVTGEIPWPALASGLVTGYVLVLAYEWTHFLIHTGYRPRSGVYKQIWRNHRLHHFKNENYWHGVTQNVSDRVLGTNPDHRDVGRSKTARTLDPGPAS